MSAVGRKVNSPQWKNFQPPAVQDPAIVSYQRSPNLINTLMPTSPQSTGNPVIRETGLVEKLLHSYGFVQCCDRDARLFFHYSEFKGDVDSIQIGDAVEFQMSYDRRSGRPVACDMVKVDPGKVSFEILSEERYIGSVVQEAKPVKPKNGSTVGSTDGLGRVTYEHNGEWFFLPYGLDDIVDNTGNTQIKPGDQVTFFIATDKRNGNLHARKLELIEPKLKKYQGVVCSMKDTFGFIERADAVKEIFFHYSEYMGNINELLLGDDIEFEIQTRNGKEVAVNITPLPVGTVIFEDISVERKTGKIMKTLKPNKRASDPLGGRIQFETAKGMSDIAYGDKDQQGDYTLLPGDLVEFSIATDRRDKLQRATKLVLLYETFDKTTERRETGTVVNLKEGYGFIQCAERDARMFFHFSELLDKSKETNLDDEVEFTVAQDPTQPSRQVASRIRGIPKGSIGSVIVKPEKYIGTIEREPSVYRSPSKTGAGKEGEPGSIVFDMDGAIHKIIYNHKDLMDHRNIPRFGDKVDFNIGEQRRPGGPVRMAVNVRLVLRNITGKSQGFIATLKDNYGFIENVDHDKEVFFHFSSYDGNANDLDLGDEVEYTLARKSSKLSGENVKRLPKGTVPRNFTLGEDITMYQGKVIRPMRIVNPDQEEYSGLVQIGGDDDPEALTYPYSITSLSDKRDFLQKGDAVKFQVAVSSIGEEKRAINMCAVRQFVKAKVDSVKDKQYGFLNYEVEEGKKLFFHMTEVSGGIEIQAGDEVEFVVVQNLQYGFLNYEVEEGKKLFFHMTEVSGGIEIQAGDEVEFVVVQNQRNWKYWSNLKYAANVNIDQYGFLNYEVEEGKKLFFHMTEVSGGIEIQAGDEVEFVVVQNLQYGFLNYEVEEGKKLFFHMTEVSGGIEIQAGDEVEFVVVQNQRNGKYSACCLRKITTVEKKRPERLLSRLKSMNEEMVGPRVVVLRPPKGPDGTKGFAQPRTPWSPPS